MRTPSAPTFFRSGGTQSVESWMKTPMIRLPMRAPVAEPRPPRVTAANISSRMSKPIEKLTCCASPNSTPARPARAAPTAHTSRITRSTSMPDAAASDGLSATARVALPMRVPTSAHRTSAIASTATPMLQ